MIAVKLKKGLQIYIASKYAPERRERPLSEIRVADVIAIYRVDVAPGQARPEKAGERAERLLEFFGHRRLDEVTGALCREYAAWRKGNGKGNGQSNKGTGGRARRDLQDPAAAITHHHKEGLHHAVVRVTLPEPGKAHQEWLNRQRFAGVLWASWHTREKQWCDNRQAPIAPSLPVPFARNLYRLTARRDIQCDLG